MDANPKLKRVQSNRKLIMLFLLFLPLKSYAVFAVPFMGISLVKAII